jgi:predicted nucleotidyltransferase
MLIRQLKITQNSINIQPLIDKLKCTSLKIVLYGSSAKGENLKDSDIDLFILSREPQEAKDVIYKSPWREKLQCVMNTPQQLAKLKKDNPVFFKEIAGGITLYEEK